MEAVRAQGTVRIGEEYELDFAACKLSRSGRTLKLERIPMDILLFLVERRGELVSREQIVNRIWGKDVHLDTDNSINGAIRKIRQVLKDDPEEPRFIQTVTGRGYRFLASVAEVESAPAAPVVQEIQSIIHEDSAEREEPGGKFPWKHRTAVFGALFALVLVLGALGAYFFRAELQAIRPHSVGRIMVAVLPFENLTGDATQEYFSDGMTEEMISQLGSSDPAHMGVVARTSVMHYKNSREDLAQIARELGVQYVLEGSVRRDAGQVRITAQLIQMKDQTHLWARQYDRELKDLLVLQSEIAREIADEIEHSLGDHKAIPKPSRTVLSPKAFESYNLYLKGQYYFNQRTIQGLREAIIFFQQATDTDPTNARAYAGLADSYGLMGGYTGSAPAEFSSQARTAAVRALQMDPNLPEAHAALALIVQNQDYDWDTAEKEFKRAIELNPNYATAHHWYAEHLAWRGRSAEAIRESDIARQLDPLSLIIGADRGVILYYSRQYDESIRQFLAVRELSPGFSRASMILYVYVQKGMFPEALQVLGEWPPIGPWYWSNEAYVHGRAGHHAQAEQALGKLLEVSRQQSTDPIVMVYAYLGLGKNDQAIEWLEKAYDQRSNGLTSLKVDPIYDPLRGDPRFVSLLRRAGLGS